MGGSARIQPPLARRLHQVAARNLGHHSQRTYPWHDPNSPLLVRDAKRGQADREPDGKESSRLARLEAVLFTAREPLPPRKLAKFANLADGTEARTLVATLIQRYDARGSAFQVARVAGGFQLLTRPNFAPWLKGQAPQAIALELSEPALETLAVVAYRQPVLRAEIEAIRGVHCGELLRQLMERELLRIVGRSEELGRPFLYGTTRRFLQLFGLRSLDDLPHADRLRPTSTNSSAA